MAVKIKPTFNNILVQVKEENKTEGGIILPQTADDKQQIGTVIAVGPSTDGIKVKDRILFEKYTPVEVEIEGEKYHFMKDENVLAILV